MTRLFTIVCASLAFGACGQIVEDPGPKAPALCSPNLVDCGGQCINPNQDPNFCGAQDSCTGLNAGSICAVGSACLQGACVAIDNPTPPDNPLEVVCQNCSFEDPTLAGWIIRDVRDPYYAVIAGGRGIERGFFTSEPTDGALALLTGFDGVGPGAISAGQTFTIPAGVAVKLNFDYRIGWDLLDWGAIQPRTFSVAISQPNGVPITAQNIFTINPNTYEFDSGVMQATIDLAPYAGQQVLVEFVWDVPEPDTGPAFFQLDNLRIAP